MKISDLVNKVEKFRFEYDGFVLEGEWYKYRTTTFAYGKTLDRSLPDVPEDATEEEKLQLLKANIERLQTASAKVLSDTIKCWNAEDENGNPIAPSVEVFSELPEPFINAFSAFLKKLREPKENPTSPSSPSS